MPDEHMGGKGLGMNGTHRQHGVLGLYGTGVNAAHVQANMEDIAPTLLHLMGESIPTYMDGKILAGSADVSFSSEHVAPHIQELDLSSSQSQAIRERLENLGYL